MKKISIIVSVIILISFIVGIYLYSQMPDMMASHWNAQSKVDGYMPKFWGLFLMPIVSVILFIFFIFIPKIDPLKKNIEKFRKYFDWFLLVIMLFLFYVHMLTIFWNLGFRFNMTTVLLPAMGLLFFYIGFLVEHTKRNWFIGIRTPWTLSSDNVWNKTHKIGGKMFKVAGIITLTGIFFQRYAILLMIIPMFLIVIYVFVYSYLEYKKEKKE